MQPALFNSTCRGTPAERNSAAADRTDARLVKSHVSVCSLRVNNPTQPTPSNTDANEKLKKKQ